MKTRTNISIDTQILEAAKAHKIVLSNLLEKAVRNELARLEQEAWNEENRSSITAYNDYITENSVFSDKMRTF